MNSSFSLNNKIIVVTGGTGILGASFVQAIAEAGGIPVILGRNGAIAQQRATQIIKAGGHAMAAVADVMDITSLLKVRGNILKEYGRIDGLVNAAGGNKPEGALQPSEHIFNMDLKGMQSVMDLNIWGTLNPVQVFGESIAAQESGSIVNISSMNSKRAITRVLGYNMGKAALDCYTQWFAVELAARYGDRLRMNAIAPGFFLTEQNRDLLTLPDGSFSDRGRKIIDQTPFKRFGNPDELKGTLVWLLSDASRFVTGSMICVDGGFSIYGGV